jgi:hypothetical protein
MQSAKTHPKRKYPRREYSSKVGVLIQGNYFVEAALELGERGMMFSTEIALKDLEEIVVSFSIPENFVVITRAQVRYSIRKGQKANVGVEFTNISFEDRRKVRDFIAQRKDKISAGENGLF